MTARTARPRSSTEHLRHQHDAYDADDADDSPLTTHTPTPQPATSTAASNAITDICQILRIALHGTGCTCTEQAAGALDNRGAELTCEQTTPSANYLVATIPSIHFSVGTALRPCAEPPRVTSRATIDLPGSTDSSLTNLINTAIDATGQGETIEFNGATNTLIMEESVEGEGSHELEVPFFTFWQVITAFFKLELSLTNPSTGQLQVTLDMDVCVEIFSFFNDPPHICGANISPSSLRRALGDPPYELAVSDVMDFSAYCAEVEESIAAGQSTLGGGNRSMLIPIISIGCVAAGLLLLIAACISKCRKSKESADADAVAAIVEAIAEARSPANDGVVTVEMSPVREQANVAVKVEVPQPVAQPVAQPVGQPVPQPVPVATPMAVPVAKAGGGSTKSITFPADGPLGITLLQGDGVVEVSKMEPSSPAAAIAVGSTVAKINGTSFAGKSKDEVIVAIIDAKAVGPVTITFEVKSEVESSI